MDDGSTLSFKKRKRGCRRTSSSLRYIWIQHEKTRSNEAGGRARVRTSAQMNSTLPKCPFSSRF